MTTTHSADQVDLDQLDNHAAQLCAAIIHHPQAGAILRRGANTDTLDLINRLAAARPA